VAVLFLGGLTVLTVALAPVLIGIWGGAYSGAQRALAVEFARFFLPQIFFYGVGAFAGAILNTRNRFAAPMWAPVLNNIVVIAVGLLFLQVTTGGVDPAHIGAGSKLLLEIGTTGGIVLQTIALWPSLRAAGFRWRPRLDFHKGELGTIGKTAVWTLVYVVATQIGFAITTALLNSTGVQGKKENVGNVGFTPYSYAYQLLQLPYAIVAVSVISALMPRMSGHAAEERHDLVRDDFSSGLRLSSVIIIPGAVLMFALAPDIAIFLFRHGHTTTADAHVIGKILAMFAIALVPFSIYQLMLRVFYAYRDTRTPAVVAIATAAVNITLSLIVYNVLPTAHIAEGIAFGFAVANLLGVVICTSMLRYRLGELDGRRILQSHVRLLVAAVPAGIYAFCIHFGFDRMVGSGQMSAVASLVMGVGGGAIIYLVAAQFMRVGEVETMVRTLTSRLRPGR
jgi:putative peptidoglycan lipid II flippase